MVECSPTVVNGPAICQTAFGLRTEWKGVKSHMWNEINRLVLSLYTRAQLGKENGQALVEYTLILALVSIAAITALQLLGTDVTGALAKVGEEIAKA
jgi:Flp pilus assembly pilin Flp